MSPYDTLSKSNTFSIEIASLLKKCLFKDKIGLDESNFKRGDFDEEVRNIFCEWDSQRMNREDATPLV